MSKKKSTTTTTDTTVEPTLSFQPAPSEAPVAPAPATGQIVSGLSPEEIREAEDLKFWRQHGRNAVAGESIAYGSITQMAVMIVNRSAQHGLDVFQWVEVHASKLPAPIREWHRVLLADLQDAQYSAPNMMWKRVKARAVELLEKARKEANAGGEGEGEPEVEQVESAREKLRRLCEEDIQKLYSRLQKARVSVEKEADIDLLALLPALRDMAETIGYKLVEPSNK